MLRILKTLPPKTSPNLTTKLGSMTFGHHTSRFYHRYFCTTRNWPGSRYELGLFTSKRSFPKRFGRVEQARKTVALIEKIGYPVAITLVGRVGFSAR